MRRASLMLVACLVASLLSAAAVRADDSKIVEDSPPQEVAEAMSLKLLRGVANVALGWLELPKQIYLTSRNDGVAMGIFVGPFKGIGMTLVRTVSGATELATFPSPFPGFYDPYFEPGFVWQEEVETTPQQPSGLAPGGTHPSGQTDRQ
jgi:putative exosortase-associated protein (TIGR04073 family)